MKRKFSVPVIIGTFLVGLFFITTSCTKEKLIYQSDRVYVDVADKDWHWVENDKYENGGFYMAEKPVPNITQYIFDNAVIEAYLYFNDGNSISMTKLPYIKTFPAEIKDDKTGVVVGYQPVTEHIMCDFFPGKVVFYIEVSDLGYPEYLADRTFDIRMVW